MIRKSHHSPVYRVVVREALESAWHERRFWVLAVFASVFTSAGMYDVLWNAATNISIQGGNLATTFGGAVIYAARIPGTPTFANVVHVIASLELLALIALIVLLVGTLSCVSQGGLIYAIGTRSRGKAPRLSEAFRVGGSALWPIVVLNVLVLGLMWLIRFLGSLPLLYAVSNPTPVAYAVHMSAFTVSLLLIFLIAVVEIFALNALILQGATLSDAISRGWDLFKKHWLVVLETAVLQLILAVAIWFAFMIALSIVVIPIYIFLLSVSLASSTIFFGIAFALGAVLFFACLFALIGFTIQFQYATWTHLYRRLGEGGVVPKIHRWLRGAAGSFPINQS